MSVSIMDVRVMGAIEVPVGTIGVLMSGIEVSMVMDAMSESIMDVRVMGAIEVSMGGV